RGSWRDDTDHRPPPPALAVGDTLASAYAGAGDARVVDVSSLSPRLVRLALDATLRARLFEVGAPVQYSYMDRALTLAEVQTPYASRPWAAEMPSAGRALTTSILVALRRRGVDVARITAAAGLSATGDAALDRLLPFPEQYEISREAAAQIDAARARGGRVIAVGTSTVRALESAARDDGSVQAGRAIASLIISPRTQTRVVDALLSGMHEAGTSHDSLLRAFAPAALVDAAIELGRRRGLLVHELGDHCVIL
ncbi:MAG TPA: S-adenosylmethionine:tRNA ribosyltransferase-isomerase, partial [Myxococcota bacterium]